MKRKLGTTLSQLKLKTKHSHRRNLNPMAILEVAESTHQTLSLLAYKNRIRI